MTTDDITNLIVAYGKHLYSFCCNLTGNKNEADDLYQDTILKAVSYATDLTAVAIPNVISWVYR